MLEFRKLKLKEWLEVGEICESAGWKRIIMAFLEIEERGVEELIGGCLTN